MLVVGGNLCVLWSLNYTWEAIRVVGRRCSHCGRPGRFVVGGPRLGGDRCRLVRVPCLREGLRFEAWNARRLACGKGWHFKRGGYRRTARWRTRSFGPDRSQTSPQGWRRP